MLTNQLSVAPEIKVPSPLHLDILNSSLNRLTGKKIIFRNDFSRESFTLQPFESQLASSPQEFSHNPRRKKVVGIDSSCVLVGETEEGSIFAGRLTTVCGSRNGIETYLRAGPIIFYLNNDWIISTFGKSIQRSKLRAIVSEASLAERFVRVFLERTAQMEAASSVSDAIIAIDGSLQRSSLEPKEASLHMVQEIASRNENQLVGFSKISNLREILSATSALNALNKGSTYIDVTTAIRAVSQRIGRNKVVAAKFSPASPVFRVDFSSSNSEEESQVLSDLKFNDVFFRGYPETLRMAHHLSVFDSSAISSIRTYLSRKYSLIEVPSDDLRATILGKLV